MNAKKIENANTDEKWDDSFPSIKYTVDQISIWLKEVVYVFSCERKLKLKLVMLVSHRIILSTSSLLPASTSY